MWFSVLLFCAVIGCLLAVFHWFSYAKNRKLATGTMKLSIFVLEFVCLVGIIPSSSLLGTLPTFIVARNSSSTMIALVVFTFFTIVVLLTGATISDGFNSQSMFSEPPWNYTDSSLLRVCVLATVCVFRLLGHLFYYYSTWPRYILLCAHFLFCRFVTAVYSRGVYLLGFSDVWMISAMVTGCGCDIIPLVSFYIPSDIVNWVEFGAAVVLAILTFVITVLVRKSTISKIERELAYDGKLNKWRTREKGEALTHAEKIERLEGLNIKSANEAR